MMWKGKGYTPLNSEPRLSECLSSNIDENALQVSGSLRRTPNWVLAGACVLTIINLGLWLITWRSLHKEPYKCHGGINSALKEAWSYSPIYDRIDLRLTEQRTNGTLYPPREASVARSPPNNASDEQWAEWELVRVFPVTREELVKMNVDQTTAVKLEDHLWGLGDDAYATGLDVFHQLHCLNSLRRRVYSQYYFSEEHHHHAESWTPGDDLTIDEIHINHCVDILAQALRCSGNVALVSMHWMENEHYPFPDMSVDRKCIDFDALVQWRKENTIDMKKYIEVMGKPAGVVQRPTPDGYYQYIAPGEVNPHHINGSNMDEDYIA